MSMFAILLWKSTFEVNRRWVVSTYNHVKSSGLSQERLKMGNGKTSNRPDWGRRLWLLSVLRGQRYFRCGQKPLPLWTGKWCQGQWLPTWPFLVACFFIWKKPGLERGTVLGACGHIPMRTFPVGGRNDWMTKWMNERLVTACPALCLHLVAWRCDALLLPPMVHKKVPGTEPGKVSSACVCMRVHTYHTLCGGTLNPKLHSILQNRFSI